MAPKYCYLYSHVFNNIIIDGEAFYSGANFIYSDVSAARNPIQKEEYYNHYLLFSTPRLELASLRCVTVAYCCRKQGCPRANLKQWISFHNCKSHIASY